MNPLLEQRIVDVFAARTDVAAVYLFGSRARGTSRDGSDVDVAALFSAAPTHTLDGLARYRAPRGRPA